MARMFGSGQLLTTTRQSWRTAATDVWYLWIIGVMGLVLATYFYTHPETWTMEAEWFYVVIFGTAGILASVAGAYRIYSRPRVSTVAPE